MQVRPGVGGIVIAELITNAGNTAGQSSGEGSSEGANQTGGANTAGTSGSSNSTYMGTQSGAPAGGGTASAFGGAQSGSTFGGSQSVTTFGGSQPGTSQAAGGANPFATSFGAGQQIGGGAIIGVASTSTQHSIREFNDKDHYNEWAFIYDPRLDTRQVGQPGAAGVGTPITPGQNGGSTFGQSSTFGQPSTGTGTTVQPPQPSPPSSSTQPPL
jgi:hypothetical protein